MADSSKPPRHFTREPWWVVIVAIIVMGLLPLRFPGKVQSFDVSMPVFMLGSAGFGALASGLLVLRSRIKSPFWANCCLIAGIILIALGVSLAITLGK